MNLHQCHLIAQAHAKHEYSIATAKVIARNIIGFNNKQHHQFMETYSLKKGLNQFGSKGYEATIAELIQLHKSEVFKPINIEDLTSDEKRKTMESLIF
jgi:hypothetical protein